MSLRGQVQSAVSQFILAIAIVAILALSAPAQTLTVLHNFAGPDGNGAQSGPTIDRAGNLYGTTEYGGNGHGNVYKLAHAGSGWVLTNLYEFQGDEHHDGEYPLATVVFGPDGTLYGTTSQGGAANVGTVFNLRPPASICHSIQCPWTETVLYQFTGQADGAYPEAALAFDAAGNIYGTAAKGGVYCEPFGSCGVVFKLSRSGQSWTQSVLYSFTGEPDGAAPYAGVTFDNAGNLYGTTTFGGSSGTDDGTAYELSPSASGWTETVLHSFGSSGDGINPDGGLIFNHGNLYGTTFLGGTSEGGTIFEFQPSGSSWVYSVVYNLSGEGDEGPTGSLTLDATGNMYGATLLDGANLGGSAFRLTPSGNGWAYTDLFDFGYGQLFSDGIGPEGNVVVDAAGNVYGVTSGGGSNNMGTIYQIAP